MSDASMWLPNLVGGVSIWKLAADLNQDRLMDGRLLVPETEGADSLPVKVIWSVEGLMPFAEARAADPEGVEASVREFAACVERVRKEFGQKESGFFRFRDALTFPDIEGDAAKNYFFDPKSKRLFVINWGASPRKVAGQGEVVFGYDRFDEWVKKAGSLGAAGALGAAAAGGKAAAEGAATDEKKPEDKKDEERKKTSPWVWVFAALVLIVLLVLLGVLMKTCDDKEHGADAGVDAGADAALDAGDAGDASTDAGDAGDAGDASDAAADADAGDAADASDSGDAGDAGKDGGDAGDAGDAGKDGGKDGGALADGPDNSGTPPKNGKIYVIPGGGGGGSGSGSGGPSGGAGAGGATRTFPRPTQPLPFRSHFQPEATGWRISAGADVVSDEFPPVMTGGAFEVYLDQGHTFSEIHVEWRDAAGNWHPH